MAYPAKTFGPKIPVSGILYLKAIKSTKNSFINVAKNTVKNSDQAPLNTNYANKVIYIHFILSVSLFTRRFSKIVILYKKRHVATLTCLFLLCSKSHSWFEKHNPLLQIQLWFSLPITLNQILLPLLLHIVNHIENHLYTLLL